MVLDQQASLEPGDLMTKSVSASEIESLLSDRRPAALLESRMQLAEHRNNRHSVVTPEGTPWAEVLRPEFWAHVAWKLRAGDTVDVHTDDMRYFGQLYVRDVGRQRALVGELTFRSFERIAQETAAPPTHEVKFKGPQARWCAVRLADGAVLKERCATREEAMKWLDGHLRTIAA